MGKAAKKSGSRISIILVQAMNIIIAFIIIFILKLDNVSNIIYMLINFIVGLSMPAVLIAFVYFSEIASVKHRPKFMTIESIISMPLAFASYLFGMIAQRAGFIPIYIILIIGASIIGIIAIFKLLKPKEISSIGSVE